MKISQTMRDAINDQIKAEFDSAYIYLAMSAYFEDAGLSGMAHWMKKQYNEEIEHAEKFINYLYERGERVIIPEIAKPKESYTDALDAFKTSYAHEQYVTSRIYKLVDLAVSEKDYATQSMLKWFVDEQMEEEDNTGSIVAKLEFLGSSCIYPKFAPQPMPESCLLTSSLEPTNEGYALAKISGLKYCEYLNRQYNTDFISVMPTNLYGPNDNYHPEHSHVLPALIRRFHEAKEKNSPSVTCWGDGSPLREFLYVDDLANLCVYLMNNYSGDETVNAGTGKELSIRSLTELVAKVVGYEGRIEWDTSKPNGTPRKLLDVSKATALGWTYGTELEDGIRLSYQDFLTNPMRAER